MLSNEWKENQEKDRKALAQIEQVAHAMYNANARGENVACLTKYRTLLEAVKDLYRDCGLIHDAISDTFFDWDREDEDRRQMDEEMDTDYRPVVTIGLQP